MSRPPVQSGSPGYVVGKSLIDYMRRPALGDLLNTTMFEKRQHLLRSIAVEAEIVSAEGSKDANTVGHRLVIIQALTERKRTPEE